MCNWVASPKGIEIPKKEERKRLWDRNPDGAGIFYTNNGKVRYNKGFMNYEEFEKFLYVLQKKIDLKAEACVIHYRVTTTKTVKRHLTHPFHVSDCEKKMNELKGTSDLMYCHNGSMNSFYKYSKESSDTRNIGLLMFAKMIQLDKEFYRKDFFKKWIEEMTQANNDKYNRFCFLDGEGNIETIGDVKFEEGRTYANFNHKDTKESEREFFKEYYNFTSKSLMVLDYNSISYDDYYEVKTITGKHIATINRMYGTSEYAIDSEGNLYEYAGYIGAWEKAEGLIVEDMISGGKVGFMLSLAWEEEVAEYKNMI